MGSFPELRIELEAFETDSASSAPATSIPTRNHSGHCPKPTAFDTRQRTGAAPLLGRNHFLLPGGPKSQSMGNRCLGGESGGAAAQPRVGGQALEVSDQTVEVAGAGLVVDDHHAHHRGAAQGPAAAGSSRAKSRGALRAQAGGGKPRPAGSG